MIPQKVTIESSLRVFQYQLLNNAIFLNDRLSKFAPSISPLCSLCQQCPENVLHFFCECQKTQALWHALCDALNPHISSFNITANNSYSIGEWNKLEENNVLINHILLLFKKFLYHGRNEPNRLHIIALIHYIKSIEKIEQKIANEKSKLAIHF